MLKELDGQLSMGRSTCNCPLALGEVRLLPSQKSAKEGVLFMVSSHFFLKWYEKKNPGFQLTPAIWSFEYSVKDIPLSGGMQENELEGIAVNLNFESL